MDWRIWNLISDSMGNVTVLPAIDVKRAGSIARCEQALTYLVQKELGREDVRVLVKEVKYAPRKIGYTARMIRL